MIVLGTAAHTPVPAEDNLIYVAVNPCRIVDTRNAVGAIPANNFRNFRVSGTTGELAVQGGETDCLAPKAGTGQNPVAISAYVIAVPTGESTGGVLTAYPSDQLPPPVGAGSTVNFVAGQAIGNTTNITLCDPAGSCPTDGEFAILARSSNQHVVIAVQGYFYPMEGGVVYVKSNGQNIGVSVDSSYYSYHGTVPPTYTVFNNKGYIFEVSREGLISLSDQFYFESSDCTGQAYKRDSGTAPASIGTVFRRRDTLETSYIPKNTQPTSTQITSFFQIQDGCIITPDERDVVPVLPNDPAITGVQNSYAMPITIGF